MNEKEDISDQVKKWKAVIREIWDDPSRKKALFEKTRQVLSQHGLTFPETQKVQIHENTDQVLHLVIPKKTSKQLSDDVLSHIVAGFYYGGE